MAGETAFEIPVQSLIVTATGTARIQKYSWDWATSLVRRCLGCGHCSHHSLCVVCRGCWCFSHEAFLTAGRCKSSQQLQGECPGFTAMCPYTPAAPICTCCLSRASLCPVQQAPCRAPPEQAGCSQGHLQESEVVVSWDSFLTAAEAASRPRCCTVPPTSLMLAQPSV